MNNKTVTVSDGIVTIATVATSEIEQTIAVQGTRGNTVIVVSTPDMPANYDNDCAALVRWLRSSIPGGTYDRLVAAINKEESER